MIKISSVMLKGVQTVISFFFQVQTLKKKASQSFEIESVLTIVPLH